MIWSPADVLMSHSEAVARVEVALVKRGDERKFKGLARDWRSLCSAVNPDHPGAVGCLLGLVRIAWGAPAAFCTMTSCGRFWRVQCPGFGPMGTARAGELGAHVTALEAARPTL